MVEFLLFAGLREEAGVSVLRLPLPADATVGGVWEAVCVAAPGLARWTGRVAFARNGTYAPSEAVIQEGDEIAAIPPVSGG